ncbi:MAG: hypothetical protein KGI59_02325 [Patescibacteria group bacterium]|nr:hypothetical protein [Patescibacteria group bacterium]
MKIYIGSAVQNLSELDYREITRKITWLKEELVKRGYEVLNYKGIRDRSATPRETYKWDYANCMACHAFIAIALQPSIGLGMEIVTCLERCDEQDWKPDPAFVFATAAKDTNVSKLLEGWEHWAFTFRRFKTFEDIPDIFELEYKEYLGRESEPTFD